MRKLKLESLQVESFETTSAAARPRGTVEGHADTGLSYCALCQHSVHFVCEPDTYDVNACGETQYFDCSLGCPSIAPCQITDYDCV